MRFLSRPRQLLERLHLITRRSPGFITDRHLADHEQFAQFCAFGTVFTHAAAARALEGFDGCRRAWLQSGEPAHWERLRPPEQTALVTELLLTILRDVLAGLDRNLPLTLGVSSGFDSRLLLYGFRRLGTLPRTFTFGQAGGLDFAVIEMLATRLSLDHVFIDTNAMEWSLDEIDRRARARPLSHNRAIRYDAYRLGGDRLLATGYLGGAITGNTIPRIPSAGWPEALRAFCKRNDPFDWQRLMSAERVRALLPAEPFLAPTSLSYDRQLDLGFRQTQRIRPSEVRGVTYVLPYEDRRWVGFWLARNPGEIGDQALYIRFLRGLEAEEFFDLPLVSETLRSLLLQQRDRMILGTDGRGGLATVDPHARVLPRNRSTPFCWYAGYANNPSVRRMVEALLSRLAGRAVFAPAFVTHVLRRFERGEPGAYKMLNGLLSADVALEAGVFD